jgi:hypothetical protein
MSCSDFEFVGLDIDFINSNEFIKTIFIRANS